MGGMVRNVLCAGVAAGILAGRPALADEPSLADFFGFTGLEVVKIDKNAGPIAVADMNGDGLMDLIAVNNFASRIEIHYQKKNASPDDELTQPTRVNEFPEHWRFRREFVSVTHQVQAVLPYDFDGDGLIDLVYAGTPAEIVFVRQTAAGVFSVTRKHPVKNLGAGRNGLAIADVMGDSKPELLALAEGKINVWPLTGDSIGKPVELAAGAAMVAFSVEDFNGDGRPDIAGVIPEDPAPIRLWLGSAENGVGKIGAQVRFEMPALREFEPVRLPGEKAARMAVIERASKRIVVYEVATEALESSGDRDAALSVISFTDAGNRKRDTAVADVDGDGLLDLVASDTEANSVVWYRQAKGKGLQAGESYPNLSDLDFVVAANVDDTPASEIYVLSEKEGVVGRCEVGPTGIGFPKPLSIPDGNTPVAMNLVKLDNGWNAAVVAKSGRDYVLYLIDSKGDRKSISLGSQSRSPETILALDADQDGKTDLLLFTRDKPMTMLRAVDESAASAPASAPASGSGGSGKGGVTFKVMESKDMGQFGLVQAANAQNTAVMDIDGNGKSELLIADKNYVRAVRYDSKPAAGVSSGWQVVEQINANDSSAKLISVALLGDRIVAADKENGRVIIMAHQDASQNTPANKDAPKAPPWKQVESLKVRGFTFNNIYAGAFAGDGKDSVLAIGDDGFAVIRLGGERVSLKQFAAWRTDEERRLQHELTAGDINGDGFTDMVSLDAGEQMCEIFTFTEAKRMLYATGFKVFETKMFSGGEPREYEPSECVIADITGDGANDLVLLAHDRVLIYPQMTKANAATASSTRNKTAKAPADDDSGKSKKDQGKAAKDAKKK